MFPARFGGLVFYPTAPPPLLDNNGSVVVKYKYNAWGNCVVDASTTNTELANHNPFRYRSYNLKFAIWMVLK